MTNILIVYDSRTGNTEKMAKLVSEGVREIDSTEVRLRKAEDASVKDVDWCDGLAIGTPTHCGLLSWKLKKFIDDEMIKLWGKVDGKVATAFSSSRGLGGGNEIACLSILAVLLNFGFLVFGLPDYAGDDVTGHYGAVSLSGPRESEGKICRILGRRLAQYAKKQRG